MFRPILALCILSFPACLAQPDGGVGPGADKDDDIARGIPPNDPNYDAERLCAQRRSEALDGNRLVLLRDAVRWSCADVQGVNTVGRDDRGQEYCEYFAVVSVPPKTARARKWNPVVVGHGHDNSELGVELNDHQLEILERDSSNVIGQCIFSAWHQDVPGPLPSCQDADGCPEVLGVTVDEQLFRMTDTVNSNSAARALVADCASLAPDIYRTGDPENESDRLHDTFNRGCAMAEAKYGTGWRRSDSAVCVASMRLAECGCAIPGSNTDLASSIVPAQPPEGSTDPVTLRGFPLGTWEGMDEQSLNALGCRTIETGESIRTLVACDLTAGDVLANQSDPKELCRTKYGPNVVVYAPLPVEQIQCMPPPDRAYASSCTGSSPWVVDTRALRAPTRE